MNYLEKFAISFDGGITAYFTDSSVDMKNPDDVDFFFKEYGLNRDRLTYNTQVHGTKIRLIEEGDVGCIEDADAIITALPGTPIMIFVADCVPIAAVDEKKGVLGLAHCGWKGTYGRLAAKLVDAMASDYGCNKNDIKCIIGPSIGPCCYEVSGELADKFNLEFTKPGAPLYIIREGKYYLDLWSINEETLAACGIERANIKRIDVCTFCGADKLHSYRRDNATSKRLAFILNKSGLEEI